jgi:hypothetical protein
MLCYQTLLSSDASERKLHTLKSKTDPNDPLAGVKDVKNSPFRVPFEKGVACKGAGACLSGTVRIVRSGA